MIKDEVTLEELETSLSIPSFEDEFQATSLPKYEEEKSARLIRCRVCGTQVLVGPEDIFRCPNAPHDEEDDLLSEDDVVDEDESENECD